MDVDSLAGLSAAFGAWRSRKRHRQEAMPAELLERARAAARRYGAAAVARATRVEPSRLSSRPRGYGDSAAMAVDVPRYSRVEVLTAAPTLRPFAELETPTGLKVRLFTESGEAVGLLSTLLGAGGVR